MLDFETISGKHGEVYVSALLEDWERGLRVRHAQLLNLEERWAFFLRATDAQVAA